MKRFADIVVSVTGLLLLFPFLVVIAILIKLTSRGPVFFNQQRVGYESRIFYLHKFRTMSIKSDAEKGAFDPGNKSRITPIGKILRRTKLDEIPQLMNVVKGEMSLVGPRPEVKKWTEVYKAKWDIVHKVKPGITDNASILFRNEEEILANSNDPEFTYSNEILPKKLDMYIEYVNNNSFTLDMKIIFKTIIAVFK